MKVGKVCKATSIVLFILSVVGSILLAKEIGYGSFSWGLLVSVIAISFIFCLVLYALGEIVEWLEGVTSNTYEILQTLKKTESQSPVASSASKSSPGSSTPSRQQNNSSMKDWHMSPPLE